MLRRALPFVLALHAATAHAVDPPRVDALYVTAPRGRSGRLPFQRDAIEARRLAAPSGATFDATSWQRIEPDAHGTFRHRALRDGYALARVSVEEAGIWLLDARGHRHVFVNGEPRGGDLYDLGSMRLPVFLGASENELLFRGGRGSLRAVLEKPAAPLYVEPRDPTLPDVVRGESEPLHAGVTIGNATRETQYDVRVEVRLGEGLVETLVVPSLAPLSVTKVPLRFQAPTNPLEVDSVPLHVIVHHGGTERHEHTFNLRVRSADQHHRRTFVSRIDGSVQYYAVSPPPAPGPGKALVLSLHGAGVEAQGQAACYAPREDAYVVAATNRRAFGFDWEDWGRWDALEVLDEAQRRFATDPLRTSLTGHSMGGHGTWQLGVHFSDRFGAIAPSAGWREFSTYAGRMDLPEDHPVAPVLERARNGSRTLELTSNLANLGVYVLHGDADDNVPVSEARAMRALLGSFHRDFAYYERQGAGHWWGNACVDWPPLMEFLQGRQRKHPATTKRIAFRTAHPSISSDHAWARIVRQETWGAFSRVAIEVDSAKHRIVGETENVELLRVDLEMLTVMRPSGPDPLLDAAHEVALTLDGSEVAVPLPLPRSVYLHRDDTKQWTLGEQPSPATKRPERSGPFKTAFRNEAVLVYGTAGSEPERAWALAKARFDAETFHYRGNGRFEVVSDVDFLRSDCAHRNVVLYGNATTNRAWDAVLPEGAPRVETNRVTFATHVFEGDRLGALFTYPRRGEDDTLVGVVAGSGIPGMRSTDMLPYFVSGVAYPDWIVFDADVWEKTFDAVRGAGFFDEIWSVDDEQSVWVR
ncbi:MAG: prolyl oligopeptidase family serine peptidase [Planctomycetes bacterium]|nr:prolyl oligopeptidase family serine peptidase [Planctomycetota bacterium]